MFLKGIVAYWKGYTAENDFIDGTGLLIAQVYSLL